MNPIWSKIHDPETSETVFRWARVQENHDWFFPIFIFVLLGLYFFRRYQIDASELKLPLRVILLSLRILVLAVLLCYYMQPQWEHLVGDSRVALLIDTSASMGFRDLVPENTESTGQNHPEKLPTRLDALMDWVDQSRLVEQLKETHELSVYAFDSTLRPINESALLYSDETLKPEGEQTCLSDALAEVLQRERGQPLSGILLLSDGRLNAGAGPETVLENAARLRIPIYSIGVGPSDQKLNFRIGNIDGPERAFPNDPFKIKVTVDALGGNVDYQPQSIPVQLWLQSETTETKIGEKEILFSDRGTLETEFEVQLTQAGKSTLIVRLITPEADRFAEDDTRKLEVELVDRKDRILLFASGPMRDYQFFCVGIHRDKTMAVDVYIPWAKSGSSQNAEKILDQFPVNRAEMSQYDVLVAFDPDWRLLSNEQVDVLEHWVARQGGGLLLFAGPIHQADTVTGWVTDRDMEKIRGLYPVEFLARQSAFDHRYRGDRRPWPLKFSRAGEESDFLKTNDDPVLSRSFWTEFPGFYGYFPTKDVKPTATLLVSSGSPEAAGRLQGGPLVVEQFYGAGRVVYLGSSELWRLRQQDVQAFEHLRTRLLRHVAQGRLQRQSDRGSLTTDKKRYIIGAVAKVLVTANDAQLNPLDVPELALDLHSPNGTFRTIFLSPDQNLPGTYTTFLPLDAEGNWTLRFAIPDSDLELERTLEVRISDLEREHPGRNEPLLQQIADSTGGYYYKNPTEALPMPVGSSRYSELNLFPASSETEPSILQRLTVRSQKAVPDQAAEEKTFRLFLILISVFLLLEWTLRRLAKLA